MAARVHSSSSLMASAVKKKATTKLQKHLSKLLWMGHIYEKNYQQNCLIRRKANLNVAQKIKKNHLTKNGHANYKQTTLFAFDWASYHPDKCVYYAS